MSVERILVVEDNPNVGAITLALLEDLGFTGTLIEDAESALSALEDVDCDFDLVFSDISLPGMDGIEFLSIARERCPQMPFVLVSGFYNKVMEAQMTKPRVPVLQKPWRIEEFEKAVAEAVLIPPGE